MPPEIPPMCGVLTCDHEEPGKACASNGRYHLPKRSWPCQQPAGRCEIHGGEQSDPVAETFKRLEAIERVADQRRSTLQAERDEAVRLLRTWAGGAASDPVRRNWQITRDTRKFLEGKA